MTAPEPAAGPSCTVTPAGCLVWLALLTVATLLVTFAVGLIVDTLR